MDCVLTLKPALECINLLWIRRVDGELNVFAFFGYFNIKTRHNYNPYKDEFDTRKSIMIHLSSSFSSLQWTNKVS